MKKKLIEVALPLEAINRESAREKSIRHGHPSTLHLWWARRPLAACRAVLFASLVDDPSSRPDEFPAEEDQDRERARLFGIIEELVVWENANNERVLNAARNEILKSTDGNPPPVLDPFCGGGSIPLEAQRLGLEAYASDLNPIPVVVTKALIELPSKFAGRPPVNHESKLKQAQMLPGASGLADDVRYYGNWLRDEAATRVAHLYPSVTLNDGRRAAPIAWLWTRTVKCPNPACGSQMPLVRSFALATKPGKEFRVEPRITGNKVGFEVHRGKTKDGTITRRGATCVVCRTSVDFAYIRGEGREGRIGTQLMAIVAEGSRGREYISPSEEHELIARDLVVEDAPEMSLPENGLGFRVQAYGFTHHRDLFTPRQLITLGTLTSLVQSMRNKVRADAEGAFSSDDRGLVNGGAGATAYADAVATYVALVIDRMVDLNNAFCQWRSDPAKEHVGHMFSRQAISMVWDFAEANPFGSSAGGWAKTDFFVPKVLESLIPSQAAAHVSQIDATAVTPTSPVLIVTDPPYYDNIGYADLSDFFYVWLRRSLADIYPDVFSTLLVPKTRELIADPSRQGSAEAAARFFENGMHDVFERLLQSSDPKYPMSVFYAFKQAEDESDETQARSSTGWETMLEGIIDAGWFIDGTWPSRSELPNRMRSLDSNALASSIVLVCRPRKQAAQIATRREFIVALKSGLPHALKQLRHSSIAAVDLAQAAIGPGMAIFSQYAKVIEADGSAMRVRSALQLINKALDEILSEQESEYDADTQWAVAWFSDYGMTEGQFGIAEVLSKAKNTSVEGMERAGIIRAPKGKVRLVPRDNLPDDWDPATHGRLTIWEVTQHLIRRLQNGGEQEAAELLHKVGGMGEIARDLAYRLYSICERKGWAEEALAYNSLVVAWPEISRLASETKAAAASEQMTLS